MPTLKETMEQAKIAYKADKSNKALKKAYKEAKKAFEAGASVSGNKRGREEEKEAPVVKKAKTDVASLEAAMKAAKIAHKADKSDKALKAAYKAAKKAFEAAQAAGDSDEAEEAAPAPTPAAAPVAEAKSGFMAKNTNHANQSPDAGPKVFVGNLSYDINDDAVREFFKDCGEITDIFWLEDRDSGRFKGCGFLTFDSTEAATKAITKQDQELLGRPLAINFCKPRKERKDGFQKKSRNDGSAFANKPLSAKPPGCTTVFCGNLSFNIDDDAMRNFAQECGEIVGIRWLTNRETGDFKGCGFVEFADTSSVDNFVKKNGQQLMGRPIRVDYAAARAPRQ